MGFGGFDNISPRTLRPRFLAWLNARSRAIMLRLKLSELRQGTGMISTPVRHLISASRLHFVLELMSFHIYE